MNISLGRLGARVLPERVKAKLRRSAAFDRYWAKHLASTTNRMDVSAANFSNLLYLAGLQGKNPFQDKICLEIGCGWIPSHSIIMHLLGADKVIATDIQGVYRPEQMPVAFRDMVDSIVLDNLTVFGHREIIRERLDALMAMNDFGTNRLREIGIEYLAPMDFSKEMAPLHYDWVFSNSVLELIPLIELGPFFRNVIEKLSSGGRMLHAIHLEDHRDYRNAPFDFFTEPEARYGDYQTRLRGNRLRPSQWKMLLASQPDIEAEYFMEWSRYDKSLPSTIEPSVSFVDEADLRGSHLGILAKKAEGDAR